MQAGTRRQPAGKLPAQHLAKPGREGADVAVLYLSEHGDARVTCDAVEAESTAWSCR